MAKKCPEKSILGKSYESNSDEIEEIEQKLNFNVTFDLRKFNKNYIKV